MTTIYAGTSGEEVADLANLTVDEMKRAVDGFTQAEVDRARAQMKAGLLMGLESPSSRAERLARMVQIWGKVPAISETVSRIDAVSLTGLRDFAAQQAATSPAALALYGPVKGAPRLADLQARRVA